jgi:hypothetical protein
VTPLGILTLAICGHLRAFTKPPHELVLVTLLNVRYDSKISISLFHVGLDTIYPAIGLFESRESIPVRHSEIHLVILVSQNRF